MALEVELAMNIVQLTGVLIPLLFGITRYYIDNEDADHIEDLESRFLTGYILLLFSALFLAYNFAFQIIAAYENQYLSTAVFAYGAFLTLIFAGIPYTLDRIKLAKIFGIGGTILLLLTVLMGLICYACFSPLLLGIVVVVVPFQPQDD